MTAAEETDHNKTKRSADSPSGFVPDGVLPSYVRVVIDENGNSAIIAKLEQ